MNAIVIGALSLAGGLLLVCLLWRWLALPCPWWLGPLLENPYFDFVAGAGLLLERAGVKEGMRVLDAGCGPGRLSIPAARWVGASGSVVAFDLQPRMIAKLERRAVDAGLDNIKTVLADLGSNQLRPAEFDVAFLVTVLGEIRDKPGALRALHRALRANGILSVTEVLPDPHYQPLGCVLRLAQQAGFREVRRFRGLVGYTVNFAKGEVGPAGAS